MSERALSVQDRLYADSCGLRFVSRWGFDNDDFTHELNISQCEDWVSDVDA